ncbi:MAG TPA: hypothetical protein ENF93_00965, partial [Ignisphaera sp.]|nr:hypothetical protein [Ignisphaera sp.]
GGGTFLNELIELAGGQNIFLDKYGWIQVDKEDIIARNPDIIIVSLMGDTEDAKKVLDDIIRDEVFKQTNAVKNSQVYIVTGEANDILMRPGPRVYQAIEILTHILHPEIFGEIARSDVYSMKLSELKPLLLFDEVTEQCITIH